MLGKKVIVRSTRAGVFYGTLKSKDRDEVVVTDCRRLWYWEGAVSLNQLAVDGTIKPDKCRFTMAVPEILICSVVEIIPCSEKAIKSIEGVKVWKI